MPDARNWSLCSIFRPKQRRHFVGREGEGGYMWGLGVVRGGLLGLLGLLILLGYCSSCWVRAIFHDGFGLEVNICVFLAWPSRLFQRRFRFCDTDTSIFFRGWFRWCFLFLFWSSWGTACSLLRQVVTALPRPSSVVSFCRVRRLGCLVEPQAFLWVSAILLFRVAWVYPSSLFRGSPDSRVVTVGFSGGFSFSPSGSFWIFWAQDFARWPTCLQFQQCGSLI